MSRDQDKEGFLPLSEAASLVVVTPFKEERKMSTQLTNSYNVTTSGLPAFTGPATSDGTSWSSEQIKTWISKAFYLQIHRRYIFIIVWKTWLPSPVVMMVLITWGESPL